MSVCLSSVYPSPSVYLSTLEKTPWPQSPSAGEGPLCGHWGKMVVVGKLLRLLDIGLGNKK